MSIAWLSEIIKILFLGKGQNTSVLQYQPGGELGLIHMTNILTTTIWFDI